MKRTLLIGAGVVVLLVAGFFAFNSYIYTEKQDGPMVEPYYGTLSGVQTCLPHKDTSGPQTLECALGLKTEVGEYYALDMTKVADSARVEDGKRITVTGIITPVEMLSSEEWQKYDIEGIFSVDSVEAEEEVSVTPEPTPTKPAQGKCYVGGCSSQLCSDQPDMMSTCEYRESYGCYRAATCERQASGKCGWTETPELAACLLRAQ